MKIQVKNIGTLTQAEVDLSKDLIILCGPNNAGKTYMAYTIFGAYWLVRERVNKVSPNLFTKELQEELAAKHFIKFNIYDLFTKTKTEIEQYIKNLTIVGLSSIFDTEINHFIQSVVLIQLDENEIKTKILEKEWDITINFSGTSAILKKEKGTFVCQIHFIQEKIYDEELTKHLSAYNSILLGEALFSPLIKTIFNNVFIAPAERTAINIFSRQLSIKRNILVDQLLDYRENPRGEDPLKNAQRYPLPIRVNLEIAEDLTNLQKRSSKYAFLADKIEVELLHGKIKVSAEGEVQYSPSNSKAKNLGIHLTASIVKSLSNLVFYFRHLAEKNDFIIIDEPELNLHPDNQRAIARLIGEFIHQGFKVMISTHSDYIIREINNLIMLKSGGEKAKELMEKYGYIDSQLINNESVGAYLFKDNKNISLEVNESGFEIATIDAEINLLNNTSEEIFFTLFD